LPDANKEATLTAVVGAAFGAAGQRCMALSTVVWVGEARNWIPEIIERAKKLKVNAGTLSLFVSVLSMFMRIANIAVRNCHLLYNLVIWSVNAYWLLIFALLSFFSKVKGSKSENLNGSLSLDDRQHAGYASMGCCCRKCLEFAVKMSILTYFGRLKKTLCLLLLPGRLCSLLAVCSAQRLTLHGVLD